MKLTITKVHRADKNKDGQPYISKKGQPYTRVGIKTEEYGDRWLSGFGNQDNEMWNVGDTVEVEVEESGQYLNFSNQKKKVSREEFDNLLARVEVVEKFIINERKKEANNGGVYNPNIIEPPF